MYINYLVRAQQEDVEVKILSFHADQSFQGEESFLPSRRSVAIPAQLHAGEEILPHAFLRQRADEVSPAPFRHCPLDVESLA